jgi:hypothetical protein
MASPKVKMIIDPALLHVAQQTVGDLDYDGEGRLVLILLIL